MAPEVIMNTDEIIFDAIEETFSTKQSKYSGLSFQSNLDESQKFVHDISFHLRSAGLFVRDENDIKPFTNLNGKRVRLADIEAFNYEKNEFFFVEAKDNCSCLYYDVTGQPQKYINEKLRMLDNGKKVFIIFRENIKWIKNRALAKKVSDEQIIEKLESDGFARRENGKIYFIPYGHRLSFLLREENLVRRLEDKVKSNLSNYRGERQFLWPMKIMLPIEKLIEKEMK